MTAPSLPENEIIRLSMQFRAALAKRDSAALGRLVRTYQNIYKRLQDKIDVLVMQIGRDAPTRGQLVRMQRYKSLIRQVEEELNGYQTYVKAELEQIAGAGIEAGITDSGRMVRLLGDTFGIEGGFNRLPKDTIETLLGFLQEGGPLYSRLEQLAPQTALNIADMIVEGVGLGYNPRKIASQITNGLGMALTDAMRMTRTVQLWSYRESSRASYIANNHIVSGWIWHAQLDGNTCMSCVAMHGTEHRLGEPLNDHHNGRCAMIPVVPGLDREFVVPQTGEEWFGGLSDAEQRKIMGPKFHGAWKDGAFGIGDMTTIQDDKVYGPMRIKAPLKELVANI